MKKNRIAAGALALALGLGAVAPAVADEAKTGTDLVGEKYNEQLAEANKFYAERNAARKAVADAKAKYEAAKKAEKAAQKSYNDAEASKEDTSRPSVEIQMEIDGSKFETVNGETVIVKDETKKGLKEKAEDAAAEVETQRKNLEEARKTNKDASDAAYQKAVVDFNNARKALDKANAELAVAIQKEKEEEVKLDQNKLSPKAQALSNLLRAQEELSNAYADYGVALSNEEAVSKRYDKELRELQNLASGANSIVTIENDKVVVKPSVKKDSKEINYEGLRKAKEEAQVAVKSAEFLFENAAETIKPVREKLDKLVASAKAKIEAADKILANEKKVSLVSTAYAAEEEVTADDVDKLINDLNENAQEIKDTIKENEANVAEENKKEEENKEETKEEDKKEEENKEETKEEDKKEDKKEEKAEDKKESAKPAAQPAKKAGNNAKTGIAGVAGVAGILAAASVAYAASKRD